jgi:hypothetical protein
MIGRRNTGSSGAHAKLLDELARSASEPTGEVRTLHDKVKGYSAGPSSGGRLPGHKIMKFHDKVRGQHVK